MEDDIVYFIYVTENLINGKLYIGQHHCRYDEQFTDGYLGSGRVFRNALKKYGKENFERIIVEYADSPEELNELEAKYVDNEVIESDSFYNLKSGGIQNCLVNKETRKKMRESHLGKKPTPEQIRKIAERLKGRTVSEETRKKISESNKGKPGHFLGGHLTPEQRRKISLSKLGKKRDQATIEKVRIANTGRKASEETRRKMSEKSKGRRHSEETRKKMSQRRMGMTFSKEHHDNLALAHGGKPFYSLNIETGEKKFWINQQECAKFIGCHSETVRFALKLKRLVFKKYKLVFEDEAVDDGGNIEGSPYQLFLF